ncbi:DNA-binding protein [Thermococcus chitonophagus]|uniref:DNA-binding protein n=1 Tax=Thermococcus chitonophagus TaxID=54262 RepID=A0A2Z2N6X2_9EURY|nr:DNA-binding protein [Thermococcus chitonophagus]
MARKKYDSAVFLAEQGLQLYLKALIVKYANIKPKTHSLRELLGFLAEAIEAQDKISEFIKESRKILRELESAYILARYEPKVYEKDEAEELVKFAKDVIKFVGVLADEFERRISEEYDKKGEREVHHD